MLVAEEYLGRRDDPAVERRLADADPHRVVLSDTERRRSRVRTETVGGVDLGIVVSRDLGDGDVLGTGEGDPVVVELAAVEALVVEFAGAAVSPTAALELGHAAGNRHWDLAVRGTEALFPVTDSRERMEAAVESTLPEGVATRYERVSPAVFDDGDAGDDGHDHAHGGHVHDDHAHGGHAHGGHSHDGRAHTHDHAGDGGDE